MKGLLMIRLFDTERKSYADVLGEFKTKHISAYIIKYDWYPTRCSRTYTRRQLRKLFKSHHMNPKQEYHNIHFIFKSELDNQYKVIRRTHE